MTREDYLSLLRQALATAHGVALEFASFLEAEQARRRIYGIRDHVRKSGEDTFDDLSLVLRPGGNLWILRRDKLPRGDREDGLSAESRLIGREELPDRFGYRVLIMRRKMQEVLASQRKMLDRLGKPTDTIPDEKMGELFDRQMQAFDTWVKEQPNFATLEVDYNQTVADPTQLIEKVNTFLGGGLDTHAMRSVVEPELYRNRA